MPDITHNETISSINFEEETYSINEFSNELNQVIVEDTILYTKLSERDINRLSTIITNVIPTSKVEW